ncbi:uncharacterized protein M421DRAFT_306905 [Didymella exigua CBS 183.55]|uniref:Uncharacterized protein n=1 Tax=Didymella exigua CBS 183.55 TaxID=1150837 RepID=A0A6A5RAG3_9PLEO|nr:uncharacterized protein M421DRAFT_306905 [Didymella exigua CBS 183.55]KAF1923656.1 hypothetical protein M421DRAFT_306905 [Didymella exigua CBS 183.55]
MNRSFLRFSNLIVQSEILRQKPGLAKELKQAADIFTNCVITSNERTLDSDEDELREAVATQKSPEAPESVTRTQTKPSQTIVPPEKSQSWRFSETSQTVRQAQIDSDASHPESYLTNISSSTYDLPESNNRSSLVRRWQFTVGEVLDQSKSMGTPQQSQVTGDHYHQGQKQQQSLPFGLVDLPSREQSPFVPPYIFSVSVPTLGAERPPTPRSLSGKISYSSGTSLSTKTLSPNYTYSFEEVTFARRLMRATLESGFLLLSKSDVHPAALNYVFKLSLPYLTLDEIRARFKTILARGVTEDLDWYATPFLHLGGAGTHYQRRDAQGNPIPLKNTWTIRQIEPLDKRLIRMESVADGQVQNLEGIDLAGLEGEWFDAYDVQGYLEEQWHCRIDPRSSFAECLVEDENATTSYNEREPPRLTPGSTAGTPDDSPPPIPPSFNSFEPSYGLDMSFNNTPTPNFLAVPNRPSLIDLSFDQTLGLDLAPGFGLGFDGNDGYNTLSFNTMGEAEQLPVVKQKPKKVAWVDVSKLIDKMMTRAICLGRAPGYRRNDVDVAFREALIPAF